MLDINVSPHGHKSHHPSSAVPRGKSLRDWLLWCILLRLLGTVDDEVDMIGNLTILLTIAEHLEIRLYVHCTDTARGSVEKTTSLGIRSIGLRGGRIDDLLATG